MSYTELFKTFGLEHWCSTLSDKTPVSMANLLAKTHGSAPENTFALPFPSLDTLNKACPNIYKTRNITQGLEDSFLAVKPYLQIVLDPLTQPLSWLLDSALYLFVLIPWWIFMPLVAFAIWILTKSKGITTFFIVTFVLLAFIDHYQYTVQTLSIIFICTVICVCLGVPIGIAMSRYNTFQRTTIPVLDMLQTLPSFVYLIPLIFLFSVTESKLYGIAIILYAIVPVIRLTDLGIRLVDERVLEAANAFGMSPRQKLIHVEIPLALPNIMAGINQTIMMSLAMVVIASLVSAPGLGVLVLRGIRNLEIGVGLVAGLAIVLLAILLDRVSKATLERINLTH